MTIFALVTCSNSEQKFKVSLIDVISPDFEIVLPNINSYLCEVQMHLQLPSPTTMNQDVWSIIASHMEMRTEKYMLIKHYDVSEFLPPSSIQLFYDFDSAVDFMGAATKINGCPIKISTPDSCFKHAIAYYNVPNSDGHVYTIVKFNNCYY